MRSQFETGSIEEMIIRFSQLVVDFPEIGKIEINPIVIKDTKHTLLMFK